MRLWILATGGGRASAIGSQGPTLKKRGLRTPPEDISGVAVWLNGGKPDSETAIHRNQQPKNSKTSRSRVSSFRCSERRAGKRLEKNSAALWMESAALHMTA